MVVDMDGTHSCRCARIKEVARLEGKIAADVSHDVVNGKEHVARVPLLHRLTIDIKVEAQGLDIEKTLLAHPVANGGRTVEALAQFPGLAGCPATLLDIAGRAYLEDHNLTEKLGQSTHIVWATGGALVPETVRRTYEQMYLD